VFSVRRSLPRSPTGAFIGRRSGRGLVLRSADRRDVVVDPEQAGGVVAALDHGQAIVHVLAEGFADAARLGIPDGQAVQRSLGDRPALQPAQNRLHRGLGKPRQPRRPLVDGQRDGRAGVNGPDLRVRHLGHRVDESGAEVTDRRHQPRSLLRLAQVSDPHVHGELVAQRFRDDVDRREPQRDRRRHLLRQGERPGPVRVRHVRGALTGEVQAAPVQPRRREQVELRRGDDLDGPDMVGGPAMRPARGGAQPASGRVAGDPGQRGRAVSGASPWGAAASITCCQRTPASARAMRAPGRWSPAHPPRGGFLLPEGNSLPRAFPLLQET